jgi:hypothetical protein
MAAVPDGVWEVWLNLRHPDPRLTAVWEELESTTPTRPIVRHLLSALRDEDDEVCLEVGLRVEAETEYKAERLARRFVAGALERYGVAPFDRTPGGEMVVRVRPPEDDASRPVERESSAGDFASRLVARPWQRAIPLDDGRRVRIVAFMGACPLERVEVEERREALLIIRLFERRPPRPYGMFLIGKTVSFDVVLGTPVGARRLIDGATGRDPNTIKRGERGERTDALGLDVTGPRVEVPIGRSFDWKALTGRAWFDPGTSEDEPDPPPAEILFFSPSEDPPDREERE